MVADRIKQLRLSNNMTQSELAKKLNITRSSVNAWEMAFPRLRPLISLSLHSYSMYQPIIYWVSRTMFLWTSLTLLKKRSKLFTISFNTFVIISKSFLHPLKSKKCYLNILFLYHIKSQTVIFCIIISRTSKVRLITFSQKTYYSLIYL